jgi:hypothetical protein
LKDVQRWRIYKANVIHTSCKPLTKGTRARFISTAFKEVDSYGKEQTSVNFLWNVGFNWTPKLLMPVFHCMEEQVKMRRFRRVINAMVFYIYKTQGLIRFAQIVDQLTGSIRFCWIIILFSLLTKSNMFNYQVNQVPDWRTRLHLV